MNKRDLYLAESIMDEVRGLRNAGKFIFNTKFTQVGKANLLLLKGLLDIEGESGFFISLDRPHQYMAYLLRMHDVDDKDLWFIDAITHMSGTRVQEKEQVDFLEGPFHIETLFNTFDFGAETSTHAIPSPEMVDFFLIDNIATMLNYNDMNRVEEFIISFSGFINDHKHIIGGVTIAKETHPELSEILISHFDYMIDIEELKKELPA